MSKPTWPNAFGCSATSAFFGFVGDGDAERPVETKARNMNKFHVWLRPLGNACRVRVDGSDNAHWLLARLRRSRVAAISEPRNDNRSSPRSTFQVNYDTRISRNEFEQLLSGIPEVEVMLDPA